MNPKLSPIENQRSKNIQYPTLTAQNGRAFACFPAAIVIFIVNAREEILLLQSPKRKRWEVVSGGLEAGETVLAGALREAREEIGAHARLRPLGALHTATFSYDENVPYMFSLCYLMAYEGGEVVPGDDMAGAAFRWAGLDVWGAADLAISPPANQPWLAARAVELYGLWKDGGVDLRHEQNLVP